MTIRYKCEECGAALNINDDLAGTDGSCPRCHVEFVVPSADAVADKPAKAKKTPSSGALNTEDEIGDFLSSDEIPVASGNTSLAQSDDSDSGDDDPLGDAPPRSHKNPFDDEESADEARSKRKAAKSKAETKPKREKVDAASFAKSLMGKGAPAADDDDDDDEPDREPKKKRRKFGEGSDRPAGEITSTREMLTYFAKMGWPAALGCIVVLGLSIWIYKKMEKTLDVPPLARAAGTITLDGKPVSPMTSVRFIPVESAKNSKLGPSVGFTTENGKFTLQYDKDYEGAVIGKHYVLLESSDPSQLIPDKYRSTTGGLQAEVTKDGKPIEIAIKSDPPATEP